MDVLASFPERRPRRLRRTPAIRRLVAENRLGVDDLVAPLFVREGVDEPQPIASMPGVVQHTRASLRAEVAALRDIGVPGVILFGIPERKDDVGSEAWNPDGIVQVALRDLRDEVGDDMVLIADLCVDEYTDHGHCGVLAPDGTVDNDATLELYERGAVAQANAGADVCAPSGMMDGQVASIRRALDGAGHQQAAILAYSAKYASALYGPFREAGDVTIVGGGDRKGYQQDPPNVREALAEIRSDLAEARTAEAVTFTAASAVRRYHDLAGGPRPVDALCIGPVSGGLARNLGFRVAEANPHSVSGLVEAACRWARSRGGFRRLS